MNLSNKKHKFSLQNVFLCTNEYTFIVSAVLNRLITDLHSFLVVLDSENLSYIAQAQKKSISELLSKLQDTPGRSLLLLLTYSA